MSVNQTVSQLVARPSFPYQQLPVLCFCARFGSCCCKWHKSSRAVLTPWHTHGYSQLCCDYCLTEDPLAFADLDIDSSISSPTGCRLQGRLGGLFAFILPLNHLHSAPFDRHMKVHFLQYIWSKDVGLLFSLVGPADNSLPLRPKCILDLTWSSKWGCIYPERDHFQRKFIFHPWTSFIWPDCKTLWSVHLKKCALVLRVFSDCADFNRKIKM